MENNEKILLEDELKELELCLECSEFLTKEYIQKTKKRVKKIKKLLSQG